MTTATLRVKRWQHDETGRTVERINSPGSEWSEVPMVTVIEEELNLRYHALKTSDREAMLGAVRRWLRSMEPTSEGWN